MPTKISKTLQTAILDLDTAIQDLEALRKLLEAIELTAKEGQSNPERSSICCESILELLGSFQFL
jgi:hypothetical protein